LARALDEAPDRAEFFDSKAAALQTRFNDAFWLEDKGWYAIGLDGDKRVIESLTSNIGHLLWTGVVPEHRASRLAKRLSSPELFSGWGIRTLASDQVAYNPLSYHCGSVWPHDTALAVAGLARYHCDDTAQMVTAGLLATSAWTDGRLPELFAGFSADDLPSPVPYPTSCSPQAWAAASPLLLVRAMLGIEPDVPGGTLRLRPRLPETIGRLHLVDVPLGSGFADIRVDTDGVEVDGLDSSLSLIVD
jgi:glycogen debranching enzyme